MTEWWCFNKKSKIKYPQKYSNNQNRVKNFKKITKFYLLTNAILVASYPCVLFILNLDLIFDNSETQLTPIASSTFFQSFLCTFCAFFFSIFPHFIFIYPKYLTLYTDKKKREQTLQALSQFLFELDCKK